MNDGGHLAIELACPPAMSAHPFKRAGMHMPWASTGTQARYANAATRRPETLQPLMLRADAERFVLPLHAKHIPTPDFGTHTNSNKRAINALEDDCEAYNAGRCDSNVIQ